MDRAAVPSSPTIHITGSSQHREYVRMFMRRVRQDKVHPWGGCDSIAHQEMCSTCDKNALGSSSSVQMI